MPTKVRESQQAHGQSTERRRGRRMNSRVPVRLEWDDAGGKRSSAEAHTRIINPYGCMVVLPHSLVLEQRVLLRIPVLVHLKDKPKPIEGMTHTVSASGGMIILAQGLPAGTKFTLENPRTQQKVEVNVPRPSQINPEGALVPVEFLAPAL